MTKQITITVSNSASGSTSGTPQILACNVVSTGLAGNTPSSGTGTWSQLSGPNTANIANIYNNLSGISGLIPGQYVFRWLISNGPVCATTQDDVSVTVANAQPTQPDAGDDQTVCYGAPIIMDGNAPIINETGTWSVVPASGVVISNTHAPHATITFPDASTVYTVTWTISNACGTRTDNAVFTTTSTHGPIQALAGPDLCHSLGTTSVTMAGNDPAPGIGVWTKLTGGSATITTSSSPNTTITGLTTGSYTFEWAVTRGGGCVVTRDTMMVTISGPVTTAAAGSDQYLCGTSATLAGNTPTTGTGTWTQVSGPGGYTIVNPLSPTSGVSGLTDGVFTFRWTISNGNAACTSSTDDVQLFVSTQNPTTAAAGPDQSVCTGITGSATLAGNNPSSGVGTWSLVSGPMMPAIDNPTLYNTGVSGMTQGVYTFRWTITAGAYCASSSDDVVISYAPPAGSFSPANYCNVSEVQLTGNTATTGTWTQVGTTPNTATISTTGSNTALASGLIAGVYTFRYTIPAVGTCPSTNSNITVTISTLSVTADAGPNQSLCKTGAITVQLDGNDAGSGNLGTWAKVSPTGNIGNTFLPNANTADATVSISALNTGVFYYSWTITNGGCSSVDYVEIEVARLITSNAGSPQTICGTSTTLAANAVTNPSLGTWSQDSGPNTAAFSSTILANPTVSGLIDGTYVFRWSITNASCAPSSSTVTITVHEEPTTPEAGADQTLCNASSVTMAGNTISAPGTGTWTKVSGPDVTINAPNSPTSTIDLIGGVGVYTFQWTASNGTCSLNDQVVVTNYALPTTSNAGSNTSLCLYETLNLDGNAPATGTGQWSNISGPNTPIFLDDESPTTQVIGTIPGDYTFRWTISNGNCAPSASDVVISIIQTPTAADAGDDQLIVCKTTTTGTLGGNVLEFGEGTWTQLDGPNTAIISNIHLNNTGISGLIPGTYVFQWETENGICNSVDEMEFKLDPPVVDLSITKTDGSVSYGTGVNNVYTIVVGNTGSGTAVESLVVDNAPAGTTITSWSAVMDGGASGNSNGTGNINETVTIPVSGTITYTVNLDIPCSFTGNLVNTANVVANACDIETITNNNSATDTDTPNVWDGSESDDWNVAANWSLNLVPSCSPSINAIIPPGLSRYPVIYNTGMCAANLTIQNLASVTVNPGKDLTVNGCVEINGNCGLSLKSDEANGNASFITAQANNITYPNNGTACVEVFLTNCPGSSTDNKDCWHYVSSPVDYIKTGDVFAGDFVQFFNETTGQWSGYITNGNTVLVPAEGFIISNQTAGIRTFSGHLNDGTVSRQLTRTADIGYGWNLVGNPYPSEIDLHTDLPWTNVEKTVYYWDKVAGNYLPYNAVTHVGDGSRFIPSMQGFMVHVPSGTEGTLQFTDANRTATGTVNFYKDVEADMVKLTVQGSTSMNDRVIIYFDENTNSTFDPGIDCYKLAGAKVAPQIVAVTSDNYKATINTLPFSGVNTVVPIEFKVDSNGTGSYSISASGIESFRLGSRITLEDKKTKANQELMTNPVYTFSYSEGDDPARFLLHFYNPFFGIDDNDEPQEMLIYSYQHEVYLQDLTGHPQKGVMYLYNMMGQEVAMRDVENKNLNTYTFNLAKGYYLVRVITNNKAYNGKIYLY